jgi:putative addiction module component (TIGR02574 family)
MLAVVLVDSLRDERSPEEIEAYWAAEIERRVREIEEGRATLIPWEEVQRQLRDLRDTGIDE